MRPRLPPAAWIGAAFVVAAALAASALAAFGAGQRGTDIALQLTARFSFLLFLPAYAGSAVAALFGPRLQIVKLHGRTFGLAFASAQSVHLALVGWLCWIGPVPSRGLFVFFGPAAACIYLLAALSFRRLQQALGRNLWRLVRVVAMNYIAFAFATDFLSAPASGNLKYLAGYLPFVVLSIAGPACILLAALASIGRSWRTKPATPVGARGAADR